MRATQRQLLESLAEMGEPEALAELAAIPPLPPLGAHLWSYFAELSSTRGHGGFGPLRLTRAEIAQWEREEGVRLAYWERRVILRMDAAWIASANTEAAARGGDK